MKDRVIKKNRMGISRFFLGIFWEELGEFEWELGEEWGGFRNGFR